MLISLSEAIELVTGYTTESVTRGRRDGYLPSCRALPLLLITRFSSTERTRLSWPEWLVTYPDSTLASGILFH